MLPEQLDPGNFVSASWLAWQAALKKTKEKLDILNDMLLMLKKGIREGISHSIYRCEKANTKYMNDYDENKESS